MARSDKVTAVAEIAEAFQDASAAVLTDYRGLSMAALTELRRALGSATRYAIVKNTLTKIAVRDAGLAELEPLLEGPTAIAFVGGDPVEAAKGIRDFGRTHPMLVVKGGVLDGRAVSPEEMRRLADLESREVLLSRLAGGMIASLANAASLLTAPITQAARLAEAWRQKREDEQAAVSAAEQPSEPPAVLAAEQSSEPPAAAEQPSRPDGAPEPGVEPTPEQP